MPTAALNSYPRWVALGECIIATVLKDIIIPNVSPRTVTAVYKIFDQNKGPLPIEVNQHRTSSSTCDVIDDFTDRQNTKTE